MAQKFGAPLRKQKSEYFRGLEYRCAGARVHRLAPVLKLIPEDRRSPHTVEHIPQRAACKECDQVLDIFGDAMMVQLPYDPVFAQTDTRKNATLTAFKL